MKVRYKFSPTDFSLGIRWLLDITRNKGMDKTSLDGASNSGDDHCQRKNSLRKTPVNCPNNTRVIIKTDLLFSLDNLFCCTVDRSKTETIASNNKVAFVNPFMVSKNTGVR